MYNIIMIFFLLLHGISKLEIPLFLSQVLRELGHRPMHILCDMLLALAGRALYLSRVLALKS